MGQFEGDNYTIKTGKWEDLQKKVFEIPLSDECFRTNGTEIAREINLTDKDLCLISLYPASEKIGAIYLGSIGKENGKKLLEKVLETELECISR